MDGSSTLERALLADRAKMKIPTPTAAATAIRIGAAIAFVGALLLLPSSRFDPNVINMRDDETISVQAFNDLLAEPGTAPWYINLVEPNLDRAAEAAARARKLETVSRAITLSEWALVRVERAIDRVDDSDGFMSNLLNRLQQKVFPVDTAHGAVQVEIGNQQRALLLAMTDEDHPGGV